jgi:hypothetical protein
MLKVKTTAGKGVSLGESGEFFAKASFKKNQIVTWLSCPSAPTKFAISRMRMYFLRRFKNEVQRLRAFP